jgi:Thioredoxin
MHVLLSILLAATIAAAPRTWNDSIRDVYIDGKLDRSAQTLATTSPRMLAVLCGDEVLLFDPETKAVSRLARSRFTFAADRATATSEGTPEPAGTLVSPDGTTFVASLDGRTIVVGAHQSKAGSMTIEELWQTAPVWKAIAETYEPEAAIVERLRAVDEPVRLQVVLATWCGDSRQHVPRLLKAIERANNPNLSVELTGIGPDFLSPMSLVQDANVTNVPTVIVERGGAELGRFVETPAGATIESDIADIVEGTIKPHPGRHERGALLSAGTYLLRDARRRHAGTERFEVYERPGGGMIAHSVISRRDGSSVETWAAIDAEKKPRFLEVTHRDGVVTRTRYRRAGETWAAHSRGAEGGIIDQTVTMPEAVIAPASITYLWAVGASRVYVAAENGIGAMNRVRYEVDGDVVRLADGSTRTLMSPRR